MPKTLRSPDHARFLELLVQTRRQAGLTQQAVAERLERPQSFVAKYENGERRLDVLEFVAVARALGADPVGLLAKLLSSETSRPSLKRRPGPPKQSKSRSESPQR
jgi:transcriptional regulator with XRE-family HTH domain